MELAEIHSIGARTRERIVSAKVCPALAGHGISLCGVSDAREGFRFVRTSPTMAQLLACVEGGGQAMVQDRFARCAAGMAYLTPSRQPHAYHAVGRWKVAWIHFVEQEMRGPVLVPADAMALWTAIEGLYRESMGACEPAMMLNWATLVASLGRRIIGELRIDARLQHLWETVDAELSRSWTNADLAKAAGICSEHLRRLCMAQLKASPMRHLTTLRMRRADALLRTGAYSVQSVATLVGYRDPFAFSTAFRRHFGTPPSDVVPK